jgi:very-short-patch-repair endonuclease
VRSSPDDTCARLAASQFGLINLTQALAAGLSFQAVRNRVRLGRWERVAPQDYRIRGAPGSWNQDAMCALLWVGKDCALSGRAAAYVHGLEGFRSPAIEISTTRWFRAGCNEWKLKRCDSKLLEEIEQVGPFHVTSVRKTLLDLAGGIDGKTGRAEKALDHAIREEKTTIGQLWMLHDKEWTRGRRGIAIYREWLKERTGLPPTESDGEIRLWRLLEQSNLKLPLRQYPVQLISRAVRFDFAYPDRLLAIEADSYGWHGDRLAFDNDRKRDAEAGLLGWLVLRFTWAQIRYEPEYVLETISQHLELRKPQTRTSSAQ